MLKSPDSVYQIDPIVTTNPRHFDPETGAWDGQLVAVDLIPEQPQPQPHSHYERPIPDGNDITLIRWVQRLRLPNGKGMMLVAVVSQVQWVDGSHCTAGVDLLMAMANQSRSTAHRNLAWLEGQGIIGSRKRKDTSTFRWLVVDSVCPTSDTYVSPTVDTYVSPTVDTQTTPPLPTPPINPRTQSNKPQKSSPGFSLCSPSTGEREPETDTGGFISLKQRVSDFVDEHYGKPYVTWNSKEGIKGHYRNDPEKFKSEIDRVDRLAQGVGHSVDPDRVRQRVQERKDREADKFRQSYLDAQEWAAARAGE